MADATTLAWLRRISEQLDQKADKADIVELEARLTAHGREIGHLKDQLRTDEQVTTALSGRRAKLVGAGKWIVGTLVGLPLGIEAVVQLIHLA